jgi:Chitobiase/beta-hexosaminidase C-terminal domain
MIRLSAAAGVLLILVAGIAYAIPNGSDVRVNDPSGDNMNASTQAEPTIALGASGNILGAAWFDTYHLDYGSPTSAIGFAYTTSGGHPWLDAGGLIGGLGGTFDGRPDLIAGEGGTFLLAAKHTEGLVVVRSTDGGLSYGNPVLVRGGNVESPRLAFDPGSGNIYACWKDLDSPDFNLVCARSIDDGDSFSGPITICPSCGVEEGVGPYPAVDSDGGLYVAWLENLPGPGYQRAIHVSKSENEGASFTALPEATLTFTGPNNAVANLSCGTQALSGGIAVAGLPAIAVTYGGIHLVYTQKLGGDQAEVMYVNSSDAGANWSPPVSLSDDSSADQFYPSVVASPTGVLTAVWYDRREDPANLEYKIYQSRSLDNGETWLAPTVVSDEASPIWSGNDTDECYVGGPSRIAADDEQFFFIWADFRNEFDSHPDPDIWFEARPVCDNATLQVVFSPGPGKIPPSRQPLTVALNLAGDDPDCIEPGKMHYTTDGMTPTDSAPRYSNPLSLTESTTVRVLPITCCDQEREVVAAEYEFCSDFNERACGESCITCGLDQTCFNGLCISDGSDDDLDDDDGGNYGDDNVAMAADHPGYACSCQPVFQCDCVCADSDDDDDNDDDNDDNDDSDDDDDNDDNDDNDTGDDDDDGGCCGCGGSEAPVPSG